MTDTNDLPIIGFDTPDKWREWLKVHHATSQGIWLHLFKKDSGVQSINYAQALDEALCFGWIDSQLKKCDDISWYQRFTPRRPRSGWSVKNTQNIERLIKEGKMEQAGLAEVSAAKADGRWDAAYQSQGKSGPPEDFVVALSKNLKAKSFFNTLNKANKYAIYYRLQTAKTAEARENRIKMIVSMLENEKSFH